MKFLLGSGMLAAVCLATPCVAQSNMISGTDVELGFLNVGPDFDVLGHEGGALTGQAAFSMSTTSCNPGTVDVPWLQPMAADHPLIAFMVVREDPADGRLVQISDRSWLKHAFFALSDNQCFYGCSQVSGGTFLAIGCSDTYGVGNNSDRFYLGPPEEIDPWLGTWNPMGSFFDCPTGAGCDGARTYLGNETSALSHRVIIQDSDLDVSGANFYYYGYYVIRGEPEGVRENNGNSREFVPSWNGSTWNTLENSTNEHQQGTVLQRWTGATITSGKNEVSNVDRDGRVYVASKVTAIPGGFHYEYALHNRDNNGGISEFHLPLGSYVDITNVGFHDVDQDSGNDWSVSLLSDELVLSTNDNPLAWNTVYNFWFDTVAGPVPQDMELTQFVTNPGAASSFTVPVEGPGDGRGLFPVLCNGDGGNQLGCTPCPCGNNTFPGTFGGCINSSGRGSALVGIGVPSVSADSLRFEMFGLPSNAFSVLTSGDAVAPGNSNHFCFGLDTGLLSVSFDGLRCAVMNTRRHGGRAADSLGRVGVTSNGWGPPNGPPIGLIGQGGFVAGQTRFYQATHRDNSMFVCGRGLNTSQAVEVTFLP